MDNMSLSHLAALAFGVPEEDSPRHDYNNERGTADPNPNPVSREVPTTPRIVLGGRQHLTEVNYGALGI